MNSRTFINWLFLSAEVEHFAYFGTHKVLNLMLANYLLVIITITNSVVPEPEGSSPHSQQPQPAPILSHLNPFHPPANLTKIHSDPISPSTPRSSEWSVSFGLSHQNLIGYTFLSSIAYEKDLEKKCPCNSGWKLTRAFGARSRHFTT
jgi:hypothetical protein